MKTNKVNRKLKEVAKKAVGIKEKIDNQKVEKEQKKFFVEKMNEVNNVSVLPEENCNGCSACFAKCENGAIKLLANGEGFLYPVVDEDKCTKCGACFDVCPEVNVCKSISTQQNEYAVTAQDGVRAQSTSGGAFRTIADEFIKQGGYVCGPALYDICKVSHKISNDKTIAAIGRRKYVQSDMGDSFRQVKELLEKGEKVLFSGVACQVAGLKNFLGKEYDNLLTLDVMCFGAQSPLVYERYLDENYGLENIKVADPTSKQCFGKGQGNGMRIVFNDGNERAISERYDSFWQSMHAGLNVRKSCKDCSYLDYNEVADISLRNVPNDLVFEITDMDNKALTLVATNTKAGEDFISGIEFKFKEKLENNLPLKSEIKYSKNRDYFFEMMGKTNMNKASYYAAKDKYDVAVIGLWYGRNYGSMITYYGLHQVLTSMNLSVLMVNNALMSPSEEITGRTNPRFFADRYYHISDIFPLPVIHELNEHADTFLLGSDQLWNYYLSRPYKQTYYLDFVEDNKKKIAYGTSFGSSQFNGPKGEALRVKENLSRFDYVSVREEYATDVCKETFGVDAVKVLDPVFLCDRNEYHKLVDEVETPKDEKYILAYILNPEEEKTKALEELAIKYDCNVYVILDEPPWKFEENSEAMGLTKDSRITILKEVEVREWLSWIKNASYVVTDSFHGSCFAIIFERQFMAIVNNKRGGKRFPDLLGHFNLLDYMVEDAAQLLEKSKLDTVIDYNKVNEIIENDRKFSMDWLKNAIFSPKKMKTYTVYEVE